MSTSERQRRARGSITPAEILAGAFVLADRVGLDGLSMPELARSLGIAVTSLDWHFRKKEDLLRAMVEEALWARDRLLPTVGSSSSWHSFLREHFAAMRALYLQNDVLADLLVVRLDLHSAAARERIAQSRGRIVRYVVASGFDEAFAERIVGALTIYTQGAILAERNESRTLGPGSSGFADVDFAFGLDTLIEGFERRLRSTR